MLSSPVKAPEHQSWNPKPIVVMEEHNRSDSSFSSEIRANERVGNGN